MGSNESLVLSMLQMIAKGDTASVDQYFAKNWVNHDPSLPPMQGLEGARMLIKMWGGISDVKVTVEDSLSQGDKVAVRFKTGGKHTADVMGIPASGKMVNVSGTGIFRVADGKVTDNWVNIDALGLLQQLGAVPMPPKPEMMK